MSDISPTLAGKTPSRPLPTSDSPRRRGHSIPPGGTMETRTCAPKYAACYDVCPLAGMQQDCPTVREVYEACEAAGVSPLTVLLATELAA